MVLLCCTAAFGYLCLEKATIGSPSMFDGFISGIVCLWIDVHLLWLYVLPWFDLLASVAFFLSACCYWFCWNFLLLNILAKGFFNLLCISGRRPLLPSWSVSEKEFSLLFGLSLNIVVFPYVCAWFCSSALLPLGTCAWRKLLSESHLCLMDLFLGLYACASSLALWSAVMRPFCLGTLFLNPRLQLVLLEFAAPQYYFYYIIGLQCC